MTGTSISPNGLAESIIDDGTYRIESDALITDLINKGEPVQLKFVREALILTVDGETQEWSRVK